MNLLSALPELKKKEVKGPVVGHNSLTKKDIICCGEWNEDDRKY